jgi:transposase InsO family protein
LRSAELPRSVYYYWHQVLRAPERYAKEKQLVWQVYHRHQGRYGYRRILLALRELGCWLNHKTVQQLMRQLQLKSTVRPKRYRSYRGEAGKITPNALGRLFEAARPNERWVTDVTEFNIHGRRIYLSPVLDLYNQEIIAHRIAETPRMPMVMNMLTQAISCLRADQKPIVHSDQGWQYQMPIYQETLKRHGLIQSMSRKGNCLDNAVMENFFGILKTEFFHGRKFESLQAFKSGLEEYIRYYNHDRIKQKLKGLSPVNYRTQSFLTT